ncbi:MAG TPA: RHS repeat-associated core domain-containing protein, partial [Thermoanaerobaculia bacterium]|nr:RHS repeat-associated core domain-containing protein [Thermoanaerobaculia bacterium]
LDPREDPDVGGFFVRLPEADYLPTWYAERAGGALGRHEQDAARKTAVHAKTPTVAHADSLGRTFLSVAHNRFKRSDAPPADPPIEELYSTRIVFDIEGNQRAVFDAKDRMVMRYDYGIADLEARRKEDGAANRIHQASMEAGERWVLNDITGKLLYGWDSRDHQFRTAYDLLRRPTGSFLREGAGPELLVGQTAYGESRPHPEATNLRGKVFQLLDQAGVVASDDYDFKGNLLRSERQLAQEYKATLDWSASVPLEEATYTSRTIYDALNRPIELTTPDNSVIRPSYNEANLLERVEANLRGAAVATPFVTKIDYDAKGQRTRIDYANGVRTRYTYDPLTFRLVQLLTQRDAAGFPQDCPQPGPSGWHGCQVQNLHYTHDPVSNITHIRDDAQQTLFFRNKRVEPSADYTYDAVYRLIEATGREHLGQAGAAPSPSSYNDQPRVGIPFSASDGNAMGRYLERYMYDSVGNFLEMVHCGSDPASPGWTRAYAYNEPSLLEPGKQSNRLTSTAIGEATETYSTGENGYDAHGNMLHLPQLHAMLWDFKDQLRRTQRQAVNTAGGEGFQYQGESTWYVYDGSGQRVRKVTELANGQVKDERVYLGGFEIYRSQVVNPLVRETLHVMDDKQRIALVEARTLGDEPGLPAQLIRFQLGNHLGSASLELDDQAEVISYEEYFPYGSTAYQAVRSQIETPKRYRYTGKERDEESGLHFYGARYYASWLPRFLSVDPMAKRYLGQSPYGYAANNPTTLVDVRGERPGEPELSRALDRLKELSTKLPTNSEYFPNVTPAEFMEQLEARIREPYGLNQGKGTDFCWAAACMSYAYSTNPEGMVNAMFSLYTTGTFSYSSGSSKLSLTPSEKARIAVGTETFEQNTDNQTNKEGSGLAGNKVDQMLLMTLADVKDFKSSINTDVNYKKGDQNRGKWAGRTFEATVGLWTAFGFDIVSGGSSFSINKLFQSPAASSSTKLGLAGSAVSDLERGRDVVLFVNGPLFRGESSNKARETVGTHFIRIRNMEQDKNTGNWSFEYWDYGHKDWRKTKEAMSSQKLGYITHGYISIRANH